MAKFTESKWLLEGVTIYALQPHESKHGVGVNRFVTWVQPGYPRPPHEEVEANARLISCAPCMYEALKRAEAALDGLMAAFSDGAAESSHADWEEASNARDVILELLTRIDGATP